MITKDTEDNVIFIIHEQCQLPRSKPLVLEWTKKTNVYPNSPLIPLYGTIENGRY